MKAATALVQRLTDDLKKLTDKALAMGDKTDEGTKRKLSNTFDALAAAQSDLTDRQEALDMSLKVVRHVQTVPWPENGDQAVGIIELPTAVLKRWGSPDENPKTLMKYTLHLELVPRDAPKRWRDPNNQREFVADIVDPAMGVPYRLPSVGMFRICQGGPCDSTRLAVAEKTGPVLQLGRVYHLPCESRPFTSVSCGFEMTEAGQLKSMGTANKAAPAEGASAAAKDTFGQLATERRASKP